MYFITKYKKLVQYRIKMIIELALVILITIMVVTELMKYLARHYTFPHRYGMCKCTKENFSEDCLFAACHDDSANLRYW